MAKTAIYDIDFILFAAASVAEETFITVRHKDTGFEMEFENRTAFYGHHKKKEGGWIGQQNEISGGIYIKAEDYDITDGQRPRPFRVKGKDGEPDTFLTPMEGAQAAVTAQINAINAKLMVEDYFGFTGKGKVFRHDLATLMPYKGNRSAPSPLILDELKEWAVQNHNIRWVDGIEADDAVSIATVEGYKAWKAGGKRDEDITIAVAVDKDGKQTEGWHFNPDKDDTPRLVEGFGGLWLNKKGEPDGAGRMWLYWQIAHGDDTDNYKTSCFSDKKYAGKGAYNDLKDCKTDKEAFEALVAIMKKLYPEKITVEGCKGPVEIDWLYVFQEMADMAMMLRWKGDRMIVKNVLDKLGIAYE